MMSSPKYKEGADKRRKSRIKSKYTGIKIYYMFLTFHALDFMLLTE